MTDTAVRTQVSSVRRRGAQIVHLQIHRCNGRPRRHQRGVAAIWRARLRSCRVLGTCRFRPEAVGSIGAEGHRLGHTPQRCGHLTPVRRVQSGQPVEQQRGSLPGVCPHSSLVSTRGPTTPRASMTHADADSTGAMCGFLHLPRPARRRGTAATRGDASRRRRRTRRAGCLGRLPALGSRPPRSGALRWI